MHPVGHGRDQVSEEVAGDATGGFLVQFRKGKLIPTRTERHALAQSRRPMGMTRYSLRSENPGMSEPSRGLVLAAILRNDLCPACAPASGSTWVCPTDTGSCPLAWCRKAGPRAAQAWVVAAGLCGVRGGEGYFTRFHFDPAMPPADPLELVMVSSSPGMAAMRFCVSPAQFGKVLPSTLVV